MSNHTDLEGICRRETLRDKFMHHFNPLNFSGFWADKGIPRKVVEKIALFYEGYFYNPLLRKRNSHKMNYELATWTYSIGNLFI